MLYRSLFLVLLAISSIPQNLLTAQTLNECRCQNCPQFFPDGAIGTLYQQVENIQNDTLGLNGQGVCKVTLHFNHEYLGDLRIRLISPAGQAITLIGPYGFWGPTDFTEWNVSFIPCSSIAQPDSGFTEQWASNQNWGLNNYYSGYYYPNQGCLESLDSGSVNGIWSIEVIDYQAIDVGNILDFSIEFCDPTGLDCYQCLANAGILNQPDQAFCAGDSALQMSLPPTWQAGFIPPDTAYYGYTYIVTGQNDFILDYLPTPDLSGYPPGAYTICGMSYARSDSLDIPQPDEGITLHHLRDLLAFTSLTFCGQVTSNCVNIVIVPVETLDTLRISKCANDCYSLAGSDFCNPGIYSIPIDAQPCPKDQILVLDNYPDLTAEVEFIVNGDTLVVVNTASASQYFWDFGDGNTSDEPSPVHVYAQDSTYTVTGILYHLCTDTLVRDITINTVAVSDAGQKQLWQLFPNPNDGSFWLTMPENTPRTVYQIISTLGNIVQTGIILPQSGPARVYANRLPDGWYGIRLTNGQHQQWLRFEVVH